MENEFLEVFKSAAPIGFSRYAVSNTGFVKNIKSGRITDGSLLPCGRYRTALTNDDGKSIQILTHILFANIFLGSAPSDIHTVDHIDRNPGNNYIDNLRWATPKEQALNRNLRETRKGFKPIVQIDSNGGEIMTWFKAKDAADHFGISKTNFPDACKKGTKLAGFNWKYSDEMIEGEIWTDVPSDDFLERLEISNKGRYRRNSKKFGFGSLNNGGYKNISIKCKDGRLRPFRINRLVLWGFSKYIDKDRVVNHKDGNKTNNRLENLEYVTSQENTIHAVETGLRLYTLNGKQSRPVKQLNLNGNLIKIFPSIAEAERELGILKSNICSVCRGNRKTTGGFKWEYV